MADRSGKTEEPTQRRLEKARREGQFLSAKDFVSALQFIVFLGIVAAGAAHWFAGFRRTARDILARAFAVDLGARDFTHIAWALFWNHMLPLVLGGMAVVVATLGFRLATTRLGFSLKKLAPDLKRLNGFSKLRDMPRQNLGSVVQATLLLPLFLGAVYVIARDKIELIVLLPLHSIESGARFLTGSPSRLPG